MVALYTLNSYNGNYNISIIANEFHKVKIILL